MKIKVRSNDNSENTTFPYAASLDPYGNQGIKKPEKINYRTPKPERDSLAFFIDKKYEENTDTNETPNNINSI